MPQYEITTELTTDHRGFWMLYVTERSSTSQTGKNYGVTAPLFNDSDRMCFSTYDNESFKVPRNWEFLG